MTEPEPFPWADDELKARLMKDPVAALKEHGVTVPTTLPFEVIRDVVRMVWLMWVDGKVVPREKFYIDPNDEGLLFGKGVWESTRTVDGEPWLWELHIERLLKTAKLVGIDLDPARLPDKYQVTDYVRGLTSADVVIRLNATAGRTGKPGIVWMTAALKPYPSASMKLQTIRNPVPKDQPYLMWKTFQYATRLRTSQNAWKAGFDSALLVDDDDNLLEASHANLFLRLPDGWATPAADGGLLPGTVREHVLKHSPIPMREQVLPKALLAKVSEAFLTNSNLGLVPITQIDSFNFPIGSETQAIHRWLTPDLATGKPMRQV